LIDKGDVYHICLKLRHSTQFPTIHLRLAGRSRFEN
jgi:hypothetical protein